MIYPAPGFILVEIVEPETVTKGGLHLTQSTTDKSIYGKVVYIGKAKVLEGGVVSDAPSFISLNDSQEVYSHRLVEGDIILFKKHTEHKIDELSGIEYALLSFESILGLKI